MVKIPMGLYWTRIHGGQESSGEREKGKYYKKIREQLLNDAIQHPDIPLNSEQINEVKKTISNMKKKQFFINYMNKFKSLLS